MDINTMSPEETISLYASLREDFEKQQAEWLKRLSVINVLHVINVIIIIGSLIYGYFRGRNISEDTWDIIFYMAECLVVALGVVLIFSVLWKIVFFFVRLSIKTGLSKLKKKLGDMYLLKSSLISQLALSPNIAENDPHLANLFTNKKNKWHSIEYDLYQCQCLYLERQLKKMRSSEWQWIGNVLKILLVVAGIILGIAMFVVAILFILLSIYFAPKDNHQDYSYHSDHDDDWKPSNDKPSKHEVLLKDIEELEAYIIKQQSNAEKMKESLHKWGVPDSRLLRNELPLILLNKN